MKFPLYCLGVCKEMKSDIEVIGIPVDLLKFELNSID